MWEDAVWRDEPSTIGVASHEELECPGVRYCPLLRRLGNAPQRCTPARYVAERKLFGKLPLPIDGIETQKGTLRSDRGHITVLLAYSLFTAKQNILL